MGINTIDLYLIWNWHEPDAHTIDFDGHTNPQRNLRKLFTLPHELGFKVIVRPGPVIRNEWRNGGYPDWLLERPDYNMPLHDVLEGRYPATATLQNAQADAAADEWLHNPVHLRYAARWLHDALTAIVPWSHDVIAIALDDDQGAYIDNETWPAPHWHQYIELAQGAGASDRRDARAALHQHLSNEGHGVFAGVGVGQLVPERHVPHRRSRYRADRALVWTLADAKRVPLMSSEFQAGWLQGANETKPRAAAPENTTIALHKMLQMGVRGVVDFPVQDTRNPAG